MVVLTILYLLFGMNLLHVLTEDGINFYKDGRFWMTFISIIFLLTLTASTYAN